MQIPTEDIRESFFFSNQFIKSSTRVDIEKDLSNKFNIEVSIFDALWCTNAVFYHGCKDIALDCLNFSDEYKKKREIIGEIDKYRLDRLDEIENSILLRQINGVDTGYIDELQEACILSRGLERPRIETEGRFLVGRYVSVNIMVPLNKSSI